MNKIPSLMQHLSGRFGRAIGAFRAALVSCAALLASTAVHAEILNIRAMEIAGEATVTATPWDIGHKDALFNRNFDDVYRTNGSNPANNPAIVTVEFDEAVTSGASRFVVFASPHLVTLEAADSVSDLDSKTGSYVEIFRDFRSEDGALGWIEWNDAPVTRKVFRWSLERIERDDYVHIREIELQTAEPIETLESGGQTIMINTVELDPGELDLPVGNSRQVTALGSLSFGPVTYDVSEALNWSSSNTAAVQVSQDGNVTAVGPGEAVVTASFGQVSASLPVVTRTPRAADLNAGFIHRTPEYERFRVDFTSDQVIQDGFETQKKWPAPGEMVTYTAHVFNRGDMAAYDVPYVWRFDGVVVDSGEIAVMEPGVRHMLTYQAPWPADTVQTVDINTGVHSFDPIQYERAVGNHTVEIELDPHNAIPEFSEINNSVLDYINAAQFHFYMEQHTYDNFIRRPNFLETYSPEDWAQMQLEALARKMWVSGGRQRVRLSMLEVVPDGTLNPGGTHEPIGVITWTTDGVWGFDWPVDYLEAFIKRTDQALVHELAHQLGVIDIYQYDVAIGNMHITHPVTAQRVEDTALMPRVSPWNVYYGMEQYLYKNGQVTIDWTDRGAMAITGARYFGPGTIAGLNRNIGLRRGFYGDYLGAIPQGDISLRLVNADGSAVANADLRIFQRDVIGIVPDNPKFIGTTDASGRWTFPNVTEPGWQGGLAVDTPWSFKRTNGVYLKGPEPVGGNAVLVIEARFQYGGQEQTEYHFLEVDRVNLLFEQGFTEDAEVDFVTHVSRTENNSFPLITFNTSDTITMTEGEQQRVIVTATDADGDPVTLEATPIANSVVLTQPGRLGFELNPDALQVNVHDGQIDYATVVITASDGKATVARQLRFAIHDDEGVAVYSPVVPEPKACPGDVALPAGQPDAGDVNAYLQMLLSGDVYADFMPPFGQFDFMDTADFLESTGDFCDPTP